MNNWKANWGRTRRRFGKWWKHEGLMIGMWGAPELERPVHDDKEEPFTPDSIDERYCNVAFRAVLNHYRLSRSVFPAEVLPLADIDLGPGSLALFCGCTPSFAEDTVWFHPCIEEEPEPEKLPRLEFDEDNRWWRLTEALARRSAELANGHYMVGCPDLVENIDTLASMRGAETLCMDMMLRPRWVERMLGEINQVWFEAYQRIYDIIKLEDGSSAFKAFYIWGPGKTAKVQCDCSAMFSPEMYRRFVVPSLTEQCRWLDNSIYHLDGTQAMMHLDAILEIEPLDAVEWTPQAGIESGGHPRWHDLYRRILAAGKSVQIVNVELHEVLPLLDAIGRDGVYILSQFEDEREAEDVVRRVGDY